MARRRAVMVVVAAAAALVPPIQLDVPAAAQGPPGSLDPTFDGDGIAITDVESSVFIGEAVVDPAGRILVHVLNDDDQVWRLIPTADSVELDPTYGGGDGVVNLGLDGKMFVRDLAARPNGGFIVSGSAAGTHCGASNSLGRPALARFDANGVLDTTFGNSDGGNLLCLTSEGFFNSAQDVVVDSQDRYAMLGVATVGSESRIAITRGPGQTYSQAPVTESDGDIVSWQYGAAGELAVTASDEIMFAVVARQTVTTPGPVILSFGGRFGAPVQTPGVTDVVLVGRLDQPASGPPTLDPGFDTDGFLTEPVDKMVDRMELSVDSDGSPAVAMSLFSGPAPIPLRLVEWPPTGGSKRSDDLVPIGNVARVDDLVHVPGGFVAVGVTNEARPDGNLGLAVAARDRAAGVAGGAAHSFPLTSLFDQTAVVVGGEVLVGQWFAGYERGNEIAFNRLEPTGNPALLVGIDPSFGDEDGFVRFAGDNADQGLATVVQLDGKPVVGGSRSPRRGFVLRHRQDGTLDPDFGGEDFDPAGVANLPFAVNGVALDRRDNGVVAVGTDDFEGPPLGTVLRLLSDGTPDPGWDDGTAVNEDPMGEGTEFRDVAVQPDGKVVVVGDGLGCSGFECEFDADFHQQIVVGRFLPDGSPDSTFGDEGFAFVGAVAGTNRELAQGRGVALQPDGRIVVTGRLGNSLVLARLEADGDPDPTFAAPAGVFGPGVLVDPIPQGVGRDVALRSDGRIVVSGDRLVLDCSAGVACFSNPFAIALQYSSTGARDPAFGTGGLTQLTTAVSQGAGVAVDSSGNVLVGGMAIVPSTGPDLLVARLLPGGSPDPSFGAGGIVTTHVSQSEAGNGLALAPDGKVLITGVNSDDRGVRVVTARYDAAGVSQQFDCGSLAVDAVTSPGSPTHTPPPGALRRAGDPDTTFNGTGSAISELSSNFDGAVDAAVHGDGMLVLDEDGRVWRFAGDGTLDASFADDGVLDVSDAVVDPQLGLSAVALAVRADGTFAVGGRVFGDEFGAPNGRFVGAASFSADGTLEWFAPVANDGFDITAITDPPNGTAALNADGTIAYTPDSGFTGIDSFEYTISDRTGLTDTATVNVRVGGDPSFPPLVNDDTFLLHEGTSSTTRNVVENDVMGEALGNPNNLDITNISDPPNGTATQPFLGWIRYTPDSGFTGLDTFTYTVQDDEGQTAVGTVRVFVLGGNTLPGPVAADNAGTAEPGTPSTVHVLFNDLASASLGFVGFGDVDVAVRSDGSVVLAGTGDLTSGGEQSDAIALGTISRDGSTVFVTAEAPFPPTPGFISSFLSTDSVVVQSDDKVVVTGHVNFDDVFVTRWLANLSGLDKSFSGDGFDVVRRLGASRAPVAIQPSDGTIAVATDWENDPAVWFLRRWDDETGTLQSTTSVAFGGEVDGAEPVALVAAPDGSLLVTGSALDFDNVQPHTVAAALFSPDGVLATPAPNLFPIGGGDTFAGAAVAFPDRFVVAGTTREEVDAEPIVLNRLVLLGLTPDAELDPAFGSNGCVPHRTPSDEGAAVAVAPDGSLYAGGTLASGFNFGGDAAGAGATDEGPDTADSSGGGNGGFVVRHAPGGPIDATFHPTGIPGAQVLPYPDAEDLNGFMHVHDLAVAPDGTVVAVGHDTDHFDEPAVVARLLPNGGYDPAFNEGQPLVLVPEFADGAELDGVAVGADGTIVAVGTRDVDIDGDDPGEIFVLRLLPDGTPDPDFGTAGDGTAPVIVADHAQGRAIAIHPTGRLVVTGTAGPAPTVAVVARLGRTGGLDLSFGTGGVVLDDVAVGADEGRAVAARPDGRIVVAGVNDSDGTPNLFVTQYRADGSRDALFGTGGEFVTGLGFGETMANDMVLDAVGNAVVVGSVAPSAGADRDVLVFRVRPAGDRDPIFGANGVKSDLGGDDTAEGVALGPDGAIAVAGTTVGGRGERLFVSRYDPGANLQCTPAPVTFGAALVGTSSLASTITCTNLGPGSLATTGVTVGGQNPADFSVTANGCVNATLLPGASCPISVVSRPSVIGDRRATLGVTHTGTERVDFVSLQGRGDAGTFSAAPNPLEFGEVRPLATSASQRVTVTNTGVLAMTVSSVSVTGAQAADFAIVGTNCNVVVIGPGGSCIVDVTFTPTGADPILRQAALQFADDTPGTPHTVALQGTVAEPTLIASPGVGQRGQVVALIGSNFPAGQEVTVVWTDPLDDFATVDFPEQPLTATVSANGTFTLQMPVFRRTPTGTRFARATAGVFTADAPFLVTLPTGTPLEFISRG